MNSSCCECSFRFNEFWPTLDSAKELRLRHTCALDSVSASNLKSELKPSGSAQSGRNDGFSP